MGSYPKPPISRPTWSPDEGGKAVGFATAEATDSTDIEQMADTNIPANTMPFTRSGVPKVKTGAL
ncbi:hypothetical protein [Aestuariivirga sp.]|uniref:hypothetical protein n=1 Tax=Aestuariivirga sp. TaxID=2650926 RepID=UPI0039E2B87B